MTYINVCEDPYHNEVFKNDNYRIYNVNMKPNDETKFHQHLYNSLYVCISNVKFMEVLYDGKSGLVDVPAGTVVPRPYDVDKTIHKGINQENDLFIVCVEANNKYNLSDEKIHLNPNFNNEFFNVYNIDLSNQSNSLYIKKNSILILFNDDTKFTLNDQTYTFKKAGDFINLNIGDVLEFDQLDDKVLLIEIK